MKIIKNIFKLIIFIFILLNISCSEDKTIDIKNLQVRGELVYEINNESPFSGNVIAKYSNGQIKRKTQYSEGRKDGHFVMYYKNGQKEAEGNYDKGQEDGHFLTWFINGQKKTEGEMNEGKLNGLLTEWSNDGKKIIETNYEDGKKNGIEITWYDNGQKEKEATYKNDNLNGEFKTWFENGQLAEIGYYKEGRKDGEWKSWDVSGNEAAVYIYYTIDGKTMKDVKIGEQIWMIKNLNVDHFRNGDEIPQVRTQEEWNKFGENKKPAWCYFKNRPKNGKKYGKLYNWFAVNDPRGLAPEGWHIPSFEEFKELKATVSGDAAKLLQINQKIDGNNYTPTNLTGFSALFAGERGKYIFSSLGEVTNFWTTTENNTDSNSAYTMQLSGLGVLHGDVRIANPNIYFDEYSKKNMGYSVRCLKD